MKLVSLYNCCACMFVFLCAFICMCLCVCSVLSFFVFFFLLRLLLRREEAVVTVVDNHGSTLPVRNRDMRDDDRLQESGPHLSYHCLTTRHNRNNLGFKKIRNTLVIEKRTRSIGGSDYYNSHCQLRGLTVNPSHIHYEPLFATLMS